VTYVLKSSGRIYQLITLQWKRRNLKVEGWQTWRYHAVFTSRMGMTSSVEVVMIEPHLWVSFLVPRCSPLFLFDKLIPKSPQLWNKHVTGWLASFTPILVYTDAFTKLLLSSHSIHKQNVWSLEFTKDEQKDKRIWWKNLGR